MRLKRLFLASALISAVSLALFCSRSDVITGAGGTVVGDVDSTLINLGLGFVMDTLHHYCDGAVGDAFSLPRPSRDSSFSTTMSSSNMLIGVTDEGDTLAAHVQYRITGGASYAAEYAADRGHVWHEGAYLYFKAADTIGGSEEIKLFFSDTLREFAPVSREVTDANSCDSCKISLTGMGALDSLRLPDSTADRLFAIRRSLDTAAFMDMAFSIVDYTGQMRKLENPYIILKVNVMKGYNDSTKVPDKVPDKFTCSAGRYTAFENLQNRSVGLTEAERRAKELYSSYYTKRTAVFKVNVTRVFDSLSSQRYGGKWDAGKWELLNAVASFRDNSNSVMDSTDTLSFRTKNLGKYKMFVLDTLLENEYANNENPTDDEKSLLLHNIFANIGSTAPNRPYYTHQFKTTMRSVMNKYARGDEPYIYIYIRPVEEGGVIVLDHTVKIELVFTPSRSR